MELSFWSFSPAIILIATLVIAHVYLNRKGKNLPHASEIDKTIWKVEAFSWCFFIFFIYCGTHGDTFLDLSEVDFTAASNVQIEQVMKNQAELAQAIKRHSYSIYWFGFYAAMYILIIASSFGVLRKSRDKKLIESNPDTKRPLDL